MKLAGRNFLQTCLLAALAVLLTVAVPAQSLNVLQVKCVDANGRGLKGVKVFVQEIRNPKILDKKSNRRGLTVFKKLADGIYRVWARAKGQAPVLREFIQLAGSGSQSVELALQPGDTEKKFYFEDSTLLSRMNQLINSAVAAYSAQDFSKAEEQFKAALAIQPSNPDATQNLGLVYIQQQRWEEAEKQMKAALSLLRIYASMGQSGSQERQQTVRQILAAIPLQKIGVEANALLKEKRYEEAIPKYQEMVNLAPDNADLHYNLALAQAHAERLSQALTSIEKALSLKPGEKAYADLKKQIIQIQKSGESLRVREAIAKIEKLYQQSQYDSVVTLCRQTLASVPQTYYAEIWTLAARARVNLDQYDEAVEAFRNAIQEDPKREAPRQELAEYFLKKDKVSEAIEAYAGLFEVQSEPADKRFFELGQRFSRKGKTELAGALFEKVLEVNPEFPEAFYELGMYYFYDKNDKPRAKEMLNRYLELGKEKSHLDNARSVLTVIKKRS